MDLFVFYLDEREGVWSSSLLTSFTIPSIQDLGPIYSIKGVPNTRTIPKIWSFRAKGGDLRRGTYNGDEITCCGISIAGLKINDNR